MSLETNLNSLILKNSSINLTLIKVSLKKRIKNKFNNRITNYKNKNYNKVNVVEELSLDTNSPR